MQLEDRVAIVTGGSSGIGRSIVLEFAREGADVCVADVRRDPKGIDESEPTAERAADLPGEVVFRETDVTDREAVGSTVEGTVDAFGGLDVLVNNAGISRGGAVHEVSEEEWHEVVEVNLSSAYRCAKAAMPHVRESPHGRVINVASQLGFVGLPESPAYCASKGGLVNLTRQMAVDYSPEGVTVNGICPGPVETSMTRNEADLDAWDESKLERYEEMVLTPTIGQPKDIGRAAVFIASDDARFMTGHNLVIDGGYTAE